MIIAGIVCLGIHCRCFLGTMLIIMIFIIRYVLFFFFFFAVSWREMNCVWLGDWDQIEFFTAVFCALGYFTWDEDDERGITEEEEEEAKWGQDGVKEIACLL